MNIVVMDAQGGGMGRMLTEALKKKMPEQRLIAVGTNAMATAAMLRAGAEQGATGENAVIVCASQADLILAPIGMVLADAMLGEVTAAMAAAIGRSRAQKILIPVSRCQVTIPGYPRLSLAEAVERAAEEAARYVQGGQA